MADPQGRAALARVFRQVDVFAETPQGGNPLAVVVDGTGLSTEEMQRFANWTNLSETTFILPPTEPDADYLVRIFTPVSELPFAGHPTLGTCRVWLDTGATPKAEHVVQQCGAGLVPIAQDGDLLAFRAPPLIRSGPVDDATLDRVVTQLNLDRSAIVDAAWIDNGPGWLGLLLADAEAVLAVEPGILDADLDVGLIGLHPEGASPAVELRAFFPKDGATVEDPVTGSLNASAAQWLIGSGRLAAPYVAAQGTALGRAGRAYLSTDDDGEVWVGGRVMTVVTGEVQL